MRPTSLARRSTSPSRRGYRRYDADAKRSKHRQAKDRRPSVNYCAIDLFDFTKGHLTIAIHIDDSVQLRDKFFAFSRAFDSRLYLVEYGRDFSVSTDVEGEMLEGNMIEIDAERSR